MIIRVHYNSTDFDFNNFIEAAQFAMTAFEYGKEEHYVDEKWVKTPLKKVSIQLINDEESPTEGDL